MKKLFLVLLLGCVTAVVKAESYIGGTIGYGVEKVTSEGYSTTGSAFMIAPEGGHHLNDVWALGISVGYKYQDLTGTGIHNVTVLPYLRATFAHAGIVDFFTEVGVGYGCDVVEDYYENSFVAALRPGFVVNTSSKFALLCRTTLLSYSHYQGINGIGFGINSNLELGFMYKF